MTVSSQSLQMCPVCYADNKREPMRLQYEDNTDFIKICFRCGFQAQFIKEVIR